MADIISFPGGIGSPRLALSDLVSAIRDISDGKHVEHTVHEAARQIADDVRGRQWSADEASEILETLDGATGDLQDIVGGLQTSYLVSDDDETLERCAVIAGALSLVSDAGLLIRLSAGLPDTDAPDDDVA